MPESSSHPPPPTKTFTAPASILIVGSGVFGLGTAYALATRDAFSKSSITVLDRSADDGLFPARDASSVDSSRIVRADYADPAYAALAAEAQVQWRKNGDEDLGGQGRYTESGLVVVADRDPDVELPSLSKKETGADYCKASWENVVAMAKDDPALQSKIQLLPTEDAIRETIGTGGSSGSWGYINRASGWADADASMRWLFRRVQQTGRVQFVQGTAASLTTTGQGSKGSGSGRVTGVALDDGRTLAADLVILAAGAWSGGLVDLAGRATATAQVLAYLDISDEEQAALSRQPVILNLSSGLFIIPPANNVLKVARHEYGYLNPTTASTPLRSPEPVAAPSAAATSVGGHQEPYTISLPHRNLADAFKDIPERSREALRQGLREMIPLPAIHDRRFSNTRVCWYTDTKTGDFLIDYHPEWEGLFVATGGSGHAFKFLPVLGERIADCVARNRPKAFQDKWAFGSPSTIKWNEVSTQDGSRAGEPGLLFKDELAKSSLTTA